MSDAPKAGPTPRLRADVTVEPIEGGARIWDPAQRLRAMIDPDMASMLRFLDGQRTPAEIVAALADDRIVTTVALIDHAIGVLDGMFILDNERGRARAAVAAAAPPPPLAAAPTVLRVLEGDRFDCNGCGFCCSNGQNYGPLSEADRARILAHDWSDEIPGATGFDDLFEEQADGPGEAPKAFLRQHSGRCIFLTDDNLCRIHRRLGWAAKPHICRTFPHAFARTPEGTFVMTRRECKSLERSRTTGTPLAAQVEQLGRLAAEEEEPVVVDALVPWSGPVTIPYTLARGIQLAALHALEAPARAPGGEGAGFHARLLAIRDLIAGVSARLGERPGEAELAAAQAFVEARAATDGPPPPAPVGEALARDARQALAAILLENVDLAMKAGLYLRHEHDCGAVRAEQQDLYSVALLELLALLGPTLARSLPSIPPFNAAGRSAIALDLGDASETGGVFRDALRTEIHGWVPVAHTPLLFGYALQPLRHVIAAAHARRAAAIRGAAEVSRDDAYAGVLLATRVLAAPANHGIALRDPRRLLTFFRGVRFGDPL